MNKLLVSTLLAAASLAPASTLLSQETMNPFLSLMEKAADHAKMHGALKPALSPNDATILNDAVPVKELKARGFLDVPWTTNDPGKMRTIIRSGVDGLISDRPDLLQRVLAEERAASPEAAERLKNFDVQGHRGGRGLRPENTLPAFESGMDQLIDTIETDTGVTTDHVSLIWHDQFLNPESCRRADGSPYTLANKVYTRDISSKDAQAQFICDKLHSTAFPDQKNDLSLSPVSVAFARQEGLISPYVPTYVEQLFRFTAFYTAYYRNGPGRTHPHAKERAAEGEHVHFNLETKILPAVKPQPGIPAEMLENHTVEPQVFVDVLCGAVRRNHMEARSDIQSFDFRTLQLVEEQFPMIRTYYLTQTPATLSTEFVPATLRVGTTRP